VGSKRKLTLWPPPSLDDVQRLATLYVRAGNPAAARAVLSAFEAKPGFSAAEMSAEYHNLAGAAAMMDGDYEEAEDRFLRALKRQPGLQSARKNLDRLQAMMQD